MVLEMKFIFLHDCKTLLPQKEKPMKYCFVSFFFVALSSTPPALVEILRLASINAKGSSNCTHNNFKAAQIVPLLKILFSLIACFSLKCTKTTLNCHLTFP